MTEKTALVERIAAQFAEGLLVPILGAGCSAAQQDDAGRAYEGFPPATAFAERLRRRYSYLKDANDFYSANVLLESRDGPAALISELTRAYSPPQALPAYDILALLPFDTAVSFNFDESFEDSLTRAGRPPSVVVADEDVPLTRRAGVKVVKPHGTVSRGGSLRGTRRRVGDFEQECPLVRSLLEVLLSGRAPLFVGYGFGDQDIVGAVRRVRSWSRGTYRRSTAIMLNVATPLQAELDELKIDVLAGDAVRLLGSVAAEFINSAHDEPQDSERWRAHPLFRELLSIRGRPTETQVIEALLSATELRLGTIGVRTAAGQAAEAARLCLDYRPNFAGLTHVVRELEAITECRDDNEAWRRWRSYGEMRRAARHDIAEQAAAVVGDRRRIMLYSQSQRVIDLMLDVEPGLRRQLDVVVPECRAKSPEPFQNALLIANRLIDGGFRQIEFVADVVAVHLICTGEIDLLLMGVHKAFRLRWTGEFVGVVNAVGTAAVAIAAAEYDVPVVFVFEDEKIVEVETAEEAKQAVSVEPECDISAPLAGALSGTGTNVVCVQRGYDYVDWRPNMRAVIGSMARS